ncbi:7926_t:CDS:2, partial [Ambispora leptoticha]
MDGILLIDKPSGITSHKVIEIIRKKLSIKKVGHAGTLDPLATGLLVIMVGKATKLSNQLISQFKTYEVEMKLFLETDTGDITGKIIKDENPQAFTKKQIQEGRKLYQYARKGILVEAPPRLVKIEKIKLSNYLPGEEKINFLVECSKGTYIRSLAKDIAEKMGTIATVSQLRRISSGKFHVNQALKLEEHLLKFQLAVMTNDSDFTGSIAKVVGEQGEEEDLQIDIYGETAENIYFIEFIGKPAFKKIFLHSKAITYLISFPTGELANDAKVFLEKEELMELVTTHHDKVHGKTWE